MISSNCSRPIDPCPGPEVLKSFLAGKVPEDSQERIAQHISFCETCLALLPHLDLTGNTDKMVAALRVPLPSEILRECELSPPQSPDNAVGSPPAPPTEAAALHPVCEAVPPAPGRLSPAAANRFLHVRFHARGGLGEVLIAHDLELDRDVAVKRMCARVVGDTKSRHRFWREAEITAKLEHPGIAPVYGLVRGENAEPEYAMRFIKGLTLHQASEDPGQRAQRDLLTRFVSLCNTVAYAHNRGIIHRDIKPENVILGDYGETLLLDWGLAKPFHETEADIFVPGEPLQLNATEDPGETENGMIVGTPAYMSPEQASPASPLGPRSDIYSLGATLFTVLTGNRPFEGETKEAVLNKLRAPDFQFPKPSKAQKVPAALAAICGKATARDRRDRYETALELATDVENWLADRPVKAYPDSIVMRAGRAARRHKARVAAGMMLTVLLLIWGVGTALWWRWEQAVTAAAVNEQFDKAEDGLKRQAELAGVKQALEHATGRLAGAGSPELQTRLHDLWRAVDLITRLEQARAQRLVINRAATPLAAVAGNFAKVRSFSGAETDFAGADYLYERVFAELGLDPARSSLEDAAARLDGIALRSIHTRLAAALDDWAFVKERLRKDNPEPLRTLARLADNDGWRNQLRDPAVRRDPAALERLAVAGEAISQLPMGLESLALALDEVKSRAAAVRLLRHAQRRHPDDFWICFQLAALLDPKNPAEARDAISFYREASGLRPQVVAVFHNLGNVLQDVGDFDGAITNHSKALELDPNFARSHYGLGNALYEQKDYDKAISYYKAALALDTGYVEAHNNLGNALLAKGDPAGALKQYQAALAVNPKYALAHHNWGTLLRLQNDTKGAVERYNIALTHDPVFAPAHNDLGVILAAQRRPDEAVKHYQTALAIDPGLAVAHYNLGNVKFEKGDLSRAIDEFGKAVALDPRLVVAHFNLGNTLRDRGGKGDLEEAIRHYNAALKLESSVMLYNNLANVLRDKGEVDGAIWQLQKACDLEPNDPAVHNNLGFALRDQCKFSDALKSFRQFRGCAGANAQLRDMADARIWETELLLEFHTNQAQLLRDAAALSSARQVELAEFCLRYKKLTATSAQLFARAFSVQPDLATDVRTGRRYDAACAAALAGCGQGNEASKLPDGEKALWRQKARDWLLADFTTWVEESKGGMAQGRRLMRETLQHWKRDADLAGVRDVAELAKLPQAEAESWAKLWLRIERHLLEVEEKN